MGKGCYHLGEMRETMIRMYCGECHRFAQFGRDRLIERFGADQPMPTLLRVMKPCNIGNGMSGPQCQLAYWDNLKPERRTEAIARGGILENWPCRVAVGSAIKVPKDMAVWCMAGLILGYFMDVGGVPI